MLKDHLLEVLNKSLGHEPTRGQLAFHKGLAAFLAGRDDDEVIMLKGFAGTGKTTSINALVKTLDSFKIKSVLMAPTGRAAKVMRAISGKQAYTIHKKIYRQKSAKDGMGIFVLDRNMHKDTVFIVDEASMIYNESGTSSVFGSGRLLDDLLYYVHSGDNCSLVLIGDTAQLPPVGEFMSPALDAGMLTLNGFSVKEFMLTEVLRQAEGSGILGNATGLRELVGEHRPEKIRFGIKEFEDISYLPGSMLLEELSSSYDKVGLEDTIVIVRSNKQANRYNAGIRSQILWKEEKLTKGDMLMVVKNNYHYVDEDEKLDFIANGDIVEVMSIKGYKERYGLLFADCTIRLSDYDDMEIDAKLLLDTLDLDTASLGAERQKELFFSIAEDYADKKTKKKIYKAVKEDPFFNALQVKFAYAVTCHKAQGGQWKHVYIDHGWFKDDMYDREYIRWLYTAFTRASEKLFLVNFHKGFFNEEDIEY